MNERVARNRPLGLGLAAIALGLLLLPLLLNLLRGGAGGVGRDPRVEGSDLRFAITYAAAAAPGPVSGRLYLVIARTADPEPRLQVGRDAEPYVFQRAVGGWMPLRAIELTDQDPGAPLPSIAHLPASHYWVQAVLDLSGGGEGGPARGEPAWARRAGNLVSRPVEVLIDARSDDVIRVHLARRIAEGPPALR